MGEQNLTPEQRAMPKRVRAVAYERLPMTCDHVRSILTDTQSELVNELGILPEDIAGIDSIISRCFIRLRDEVTQPFRTEQMKLIQQAGLAADDE